MRCPACGAAVDAAGVFPGGNVRCGCGVDVEIPAERPSAERLSGPTPYREGGARPSEAGMLLCPFCGGPCASDARACPHCDVELASVRCPHCYALHFSGARFCAHCGKELELEPLLDATDAPCPRCHKPLRVAMGSNADLGSGAIHECVGCGGLFVDARTLAEIVARESDPARRSGLLATLGPPVHARPGALEADVHYLQCPVCHTYMNRQNFGKRSGVIVDVCREHGTWFDAGELTRAIDFVAEGGLAAAEKKQAEEEAEHKKELAKAAAGMQAELAREAMEEGRSVGRWEAWMSGSGGRRGTLLDFLWELLR